MVAALRVTCNSSIYRHPALRTFTTYSPLCKSKAASGTSPKSNGRTVTRKKLSELPKARLQADGSPVSPLAEWNGGLQGLNDTRRKASVASGSGENTALSASIGDTFLENPAETLGKTKGNDAYEEISSLESVPPVKNSQAHIPGIESYIKPRRRRQRVAAAATEDTAASDSSSLQPKNRLATEILDNLSKFSHCILLTRVGQFYESYFDQAKDVARLLNIKLTQRTWDGQRIWMCGFPLMHLDKYLKILVQDHKRFVAMCEEFPRYPDLGAKGGFDRRVVRIVTPGTLIDEPFLNPYENNYLLAVACNKPSTPIATSNVGLAWMDVSTGEFFTKAISYDGLRDELVRIGPQEVVVDGTNISDLRDSSHIREIIQDEGFFTSIFSPQSHVDLGVPTHISDDDSSNDDIISHLHLSRNNGDTVLTDTEVDAIKLLTGFMRANLIEHMPRLSLPSREAEGGRMQIDAHTIKALEIREGLSDGGSTGSLLSVVKRTVTNSGTRLLARWLCSPSTSLHEINARQSLVSFFHARPHLRDDLVQSLGDLEDASRIVQKFLLGRGQPSDLSAICSTIRIWTSVEKRIKLEKTMERRERGIIDDEWISIDALFHGMHDLGRLADSIENAFIPPRSDNPVTSENTGETGDENLNEFPQVPFKLPDIQDVALRTNFPSNGWTIRPGFSRQLEDLHAKLAEHLVRRQQLERQLQSKYDAPSLSLRSSPGQGLHVHVARGKRDSTKLRASSLFIPLTTSNSTSTFFYQDWTHLGAQIIETTASIYAAEREAFDILRDDVSAHSSHLRRNARIFDELDVTIAFANLASEMKFVKPVLHEGMSYHVVNGRHPTVELGLLTSGRTFTPNTITFTPGSHLHIITGPNMAGKSTLLRQTALISILAQTGSFVPADCAEVGIVDRVFSRIGAKDDLFRDRSTFMVEMMETSEILRRATPQSLVIMDEVGRGTTVDDGLAIAFAAVNHLLSVNRCRALFATHFHELADMLGCSNDSVGQGSFTGVSFFCTDVDETQDGFFAYSHLLRPGVNRDSHGLKVAQLAGMPEPALGVAKMALSWLKERRGKVRHPQELQFLGQSLASQ